MSKEAVHFRKRAQECRDLAERARDRAVVRELSDLASELEAEAEAIETEERRRAQIATDFEKAVTMTANELEEWLRTPESRAVGWKGSDGGRSESVGHASGRRIVQILRTPVQYLTADDYAHMRKVVGFARRHLAQQPINTVTSRWRYSLMNWGHDPLKG
jgi:hypothetical protein